MIHFVNKFSEIAIWSRERCWSFMETYLSLSLSLYG